MWGCSYKLYGLKSLSLFFRVHHALTIRLYPIRPALNLPPFEIRPETDDVRHNLPDAFSYRHQPRGCGVRSYAAVRYGCAIWARRMRTTPRPH